MYGAVDSILVICMLVLIPKPKFKRQLVCKFEVVDNVLCYFDFVYTHTYIDYDDDNKNFIYFSSSFHYLNNILLFLYSINVDATLSNLNKKYTYIIFAYTYLAKWNTCFRKQTSRITWETTLAQLLSHLTYPGWDWYYSISRHRIGMVILVKWGLGITWW